MDELALTERLIAFDTASAEGQRRGAGVVGGGGGCPDNNE